MELRARPRLTTSVPLAPGEAIEAVIGAQTVSLWVVSAFSLIGHLLSGNRFRLLVVTTRRIIVVDTGRWGHEQSARVIAELPRATRLEGPSGSPTGVEHVLVVNGERLHVSHEYFGELRIADAMLAA